jgi:HEPN domain-containing protein
MSVERLEADARRWLRQGEDDLDAVRILIAAGKFAQAAFLAQQAGEKALKALWIRLDLDPWGHSLGRLICDLPDTQRSRVAHLRDAALGLDKLYIPTRYPDSLAELTPAEAYTRGEAESAAVLARAILDAVAGILAEFPAKTPR